MGMSSSQARLLSLTARMHDIEYKAQNLEAQKLQMANESDAVYKEYENALNATIIQHKIVGADGKANFIDTTYNNFIGSPAGNGAVYGIRDAHTGALYVPDDIKRAYNCSNKTIESYLTALNDMKSGANAAYISITSADQLKNLNGATGKYRLDSDITVSNWSGITDFRGTFDGNGHTITIASGTQGLFATATGATIKNVNVSANISTTSANVGGLVGNLNGGTVENCYVSGSVTGGTDVGGLIGVLTGGKSTIKYSGSSANATGNFYFPNNAANGPYQQETRVGGLIGNVSTSADIDNCISKGDVTGEYAYVGGFIGITANGGININVSNCESYGDVTGNSNGRLDHLTYNGTNIGGGSISSFIGDLNGTATNCNSFGTTNKNGNAGGLYDFLSTVAATATVDGCYSATAESDADMGNAGVTITGTKTTPNIIGQNTDATKYPNISDKLDYYIQMFNMLESAGEDINSISVPDGMGDSSEWFTNIINNGQAVICQITKSEDGSFSIYDVNVATDTNLQEVQDETDLKKAEAKYEADMRKINAKDKKFDTDLASLESERNAISTEMDTLKTVIKDNVDRTFKLFS